MLTDDRFYEVKLVGYQWRFFSTHPDETLVVPTYPVFYISQLLYLFYRFADPDNWTTSLFPLGKHYKKLIYQLPTSIENWNMYYWWEL